MSKKKQKWILRHQIVYLSWFVFIYLYVRWTCQLISHSVHWPLDEPSSQNPTFINLSSLLLWCPIIHSVVSIIQCWWSAYIDLRLCRLFLLDWWWCHECINQSSVNIEEEYSSKNMFAYECLSERKMLHVTNNQYSDAM